MARKWLRSGEYVFIIGLELELRVYGRRIMMNAPKAFPYVLIACLLLLSLAGLCLAEPNQNRIMNDHGNGPLLHQIAGMPMCGPIDILHSGRGFALKDNESLVMKLNVEALLPIEPGKIRMQLASNKSLEEIRDDIRAKDDFVTYRGGIMLAGRIYSLVDVRVNPTNNGSSEIQAGVVDRSLEPEKDDAANVGNISLIVSPEDGGLVGKGMLELNSGQQAGKYVVHLNMEPSRHGTCPMPARD